MSKKIKLIVGSTRQNRVGGHISEWLVKTAKDNGTEIEVIDLKEENLSLFDGKSPAYFPPETDEQKAWSAKISEADAIIFVTAEYNRGIPAPLKNAIDFLFKEWGGKPAGIVSYGYIDGGGSATKHLKDVLAWVKMDIVEPTIAIQLEQGHFAQDGSFNDVDASLGGAKDDFIKQLEALSK